MISTSTQDLASIAWPLARLGELMENLARSSSLLPNPVELPQPDFEDGNIRGMDVSYWIYAAAENLNLEAEKVNVYYSDIESLILSAGPAILRIPGDWDAERPQLIAIIKGGKRRGKFLTPELRKRRIRSDVIRDLLCSPFETPYNNEIDEMLYQAQVPSERIPPARKSILREQLATQNIDIGWILRQPPGFNLFSKLRKAGVLRPFITVFGLYFLQILLSIFSWIVIGRGIFLGHYDWAWISAWVILLISTIPISVIVADAQNELSQRSGAVFRERLLYGTLNLEPEEIRHQGRGQFLGRVMESEAVEMLALNGGFLSIMSLVDLVFAGIILASGVGGTLHALLLLLWVMVIMFLLYRMYRISLQWTNSYREMTNELVENMVGHRTRLAQENPEKWHEDEDASLDNYLKHSERLDKATIQVNSAAVRGWMIVGMLGIIIPFVTNTATPQELAISLGGVIFATQALTKLTAGSQSVIGLLISWRQVSSIFKAAERPKEIQSLEFFSHRMRFSDYPTTENDLSLQQGIYPILVTRDLDFRYNPGSKPVLEDLNIQIDSGERILLEGPSGSGKSTLASLMTGIRHPNSGSLLLDGVDRQILGSTEWRRRVVMAPQFQENYVFSETFAFNLLLGRRWPPEPEDLELAELICAELGLDEVLEKMPSGLQQMLGENGWQLSHGERSRLFIARTLLQQADLTILDETFGALDPENLKKALQSVLQRSSTLLVIAHP